MFNSVIDSTGLTLTSTLICSVSAIIIALVHMKTSKYSKNFIITLSVLPILVSVVMMMVNGNLGTSVAILGAFSLIRFRSMPGNSKEILSVFFAMAIGLSVGMGQVLFAGLITLIVGLTILLLNYVKFGEANNLEKELDITIPEDLDYDNVFEEIFNKYLKSCELLKIKTTNLGSLYELKYNIILNKNVKIQEFINELRVRNGNLKISIHNKEGEML